MSIHIPYIKELKNIREVLETEPRFPRDSCFITSLIVEEVLGLPLEAGFYNGWKNPNRALKSTHCWNYDPKRGLYIDLTMDQFSNQSRPITILPQGSGLLLSNSAIIDNYRFFTERRDGEKVLKRKERLIKKVQNR